MNTTNTNTNETSAKNANPNNTPNTNTSLPYRSTLHPTLRSLWNIPHVIQIPDPMPPPPQVLQLLREHLSRHKTQLAALTPSDDRQIAAMANHKFDISILEHRIQELLTAFPDLQPTTISPIGPLSPPNTNTNKNSPTKPGQNSQPLPPQQTQTRTQPGHNPDDPGLTQTQSGSSQTQPGQSQTKPAQPGHAATPGTAKLQLGASAPKTSHTQPASNEPPPPKFPSPNPTPPNPTEPTPKTDSNTNPDFLEAAADLDAQLKGRSRFDKLSPQQQAAIIQLMDVHKIEVVLELLASPSPTGMSFKIGRSALYEFKRRYEKREAQRHRQQRLKEFDDLLKKSDHPEQTFLGSFEHLLHVKALNAASHPDTSLDTLDAITTTINKLRKQTLAERKQTHAELKSK